MTKSVSDALMETLMSPNVADSNGEAANVVDVLDKIGRALWSMSGKTESVEVFAMLSDEKGSFKGQAKWQGDIEKAIARIRQADYAHVLELSECVVGGKVMIIAYVKKRQV